MRTIKLEDTVIVLDHVRGVELKPSHTSHGDPVDSWLTYVYLHELAYPLTVKGNHVDELRAALEGRTPDERLVLLESPYSAETESMITRNINYARAALRDSLMRGEYPFASHLLYTQAGVLDDRKPDERKLGIDAGLAWGLCARRSVVYTDRGITPGMQLGMEHARAHGREVELRELAGWRP